MEERQSRIFMALLLSLGIWFVINYFFFPPAPKKPKPTTPVAVDKPVTPENKTTVPENKKELVPEKKPEIIKQADIIRTFIVTDPYLIELSSLGGKIEKFYIMNQKALDGSDILVAKDESATIEFNGKKYRAIEISRNRGFDFNLISSLEEIPNSIYNTVNFAATYNEADKTIIYETPSLDKKFVIRKQFIFYPKENYFKFKLFLVNPSKEAVSISTPANPFYFRSFGSLGPVKTTGLNDRDQAHYFRYYYLDGSFKDSLDGVSNDGFFSNLFGGEKKDKRFDTINSTGEGLDFSGTGSRYFIAVLDPLNHKPSSVVLDSRAGYTTGIITVYGNWNLKPNATEELDFAAYVGVREIDGMAFKDKSLDPEITKTSVFAGLSDKLNKSFNQGLTTPFRNGIVWVLKKMHDYIPNYGWCIIIFSILFKLVFYPLNQKQAESMKKMQELNPMIQEINEKYAKDPTVKQQKIMELYKKHNANPMGGCLPMVVQIPIFIALYTAFSDTIELWKSPFLWITDLSEPDTIWNSPSLLGYGSIALNILPLIMVGSQIIQTRMTAVVSDPNQKTMMYFMPVIMLYFFWSMPSGVTLYWTMQNILSILQQIYTNKFVKPKQQAANVAVAVPVQPPRSNRKKK